MDDLTPSGPLTQNDKSSLLKEKNVNTLYIMQ